jgi:hypothetical protein
VIQGLRIAALTVDRVEPSPSDLEDPKRLSALGVPQLLSKARESLTQAVALCYPERSEAVRREKAWIEEVGRVEAAEREAAQALSPKPSAPAPAGRNPGGKAGEPAPPAPIPPPPEGADRSPTAPPQLPDGSGVPWALGLALLAVLAVILAVWTSSRAR